MLGVRRRYVKTAPFAAYSNGAHARRYVKTVPFAAQMLDVRRSEKLQMVKELKMEKAGYWFEVEIGKSPPLSDQELWRQLRDKA